MVGKSETIHENTTNPTNPKGRIYIHYGSNIQYSKIQLKLIEAYQSLLNVDEGVTIVLHHFMGRNKYQKEYLKDTTNPFKIYLVWTVTILEGYKPLKKEQH